ncbi:unnamed protein product, partial [Polarella glacialis]
HLLSDIMGERLVVRRTFLHVEDYEIPKQRRRSAPAVLDMASLREDRGVCLESIVSYESMPFPDEISPLPLEVSCGLAFPEKRPGETQKKGKAARSKISPLPLEVSCGLAFPEKRPGETQKKGKAARSKTSWCDESAIEQSMGMEPWGDMGQ